jgi:hypothetical protein
VIPNQVDPVLVSVLCKMLVCCIQVLDINDILQECMG